MTSHSNTCFIAGTSRLSPVLGVWTKRNDVGPIISSESVGVDAHLESLPPSFSLPIRPPAIYTTYRDQQGAPSSLETSRFSSETLSVPPPYSPRGYMCTEMEKHTGITSDEEPATLARMLFKYGFFFFPFWLAGICILRSPLLPTPDWEAGKTEEEKAQLLQLLRKTELKWARRCLWAMLSLLVAVFFLVLLIKLYLSNTI